MTGTAWFPRTRCHGGFVEEVQFWVLGMIEERASLISVSKVSGLANGRSLDVVRWLVPGATPQRRNQTMDLSGSCACGAVTLNRIGHQLCRL